MTAGLLGSRSAHDWIDLMAELVPDWDLCLAKTEDRSFLNAASIAVACAVFAIGKLAIAA